MNYRNPVWYDELNKIIDCEVDHPQFGWIPFTSTADDKDKNAVELRAKLLDPTATIGPKPAVVYTKERLLGILESKYASVEQGEFTFNTRKYRSNPVSTARINTVVNKAARAKRDATPFSVDWRDATGAIVTMTADDMEALQDALIDHGIEADRVAAELHAKIEAGTVTSKEEIEGAAWPA